MVELIVNQNIIELPKGTSIKYTKQISEIFDIANVACSFTNSFEFNKTPFNTQAMQFLGISGDGSTVPYKKNNSLLKVNGFDIVSNGWFNVSGTDDNYKGSVIDGIVDFFKAIENRTMGKDLNLSNFDHLKDFDTVVNSFSNIYYKYIIADYGGKNVFEGGINIDYLTPCFSVRKLWELIFSTFQFNCDYTNLSYLDGLYLTYPKDLAQGQVDVVVATLGRNFFTDDGRTVVGDFCTIRPQYRFWDTHIIIEGSLDSTNWIYTIPESASYNFNLTSEMYAVYRNPGYSNRNTNPTIQILKNGIKIGSIISDYVTNVAGVGNPRTLVFNVPCEAGDKIEMYIIAPTSVWVNGRSYRNFQWVHKSTSFIISRSDLGTTTLQNELKDFSIKDFIKEILWRTGLTPIYNKETNTVKFIPLNDRVNFSNAQDYSHSFVARTNEIYTNGYAQKNIFKLKNNNDDDNQGDGYLYVINSNIDDEKIIAQSKIYAPDKKIVTSFINGIKTNQYKIWETEAKDNEGTLEIKYKGLSGRFYFIRKEDLSGSFKIISEILEDEIVVSSVPVGINTNTLFEEAIYNNYAEYQKIFTNFRIHSIQLNVTEVDFLGLDLTRPVYFKQENAYYVCNKVDFQEGQFSNGEFIKINK